MNVYLSHHFFSLKFYRSVRRIYDLLKVHEEYTYIYYNSQ